MPRLTSVLLTVLVFTIVCSALPNYQQEDHPDVEDTSSRALRTVFYPVRFVISNWIKKLFPCPEGANSVTSGSDYYMRLMPISGGTCAPSTITTSTAPTTTTTTKTPCFDTCGISSRRSLRFYGDSYAASADEFPWNVRVSYNGFPGMGALIHPEWVLTAASFVKSFGDVTFTLQAGLVKWDDKELQSATGKAIFHPDFTNSPAPSLYVLNNDIALIKVDTPFKITSSVHPICLPFKEAGSSLASSQVIMGGFGMNLASNNTFSFGSMTVLAEDNSNCPSVGYATKTICLPISQQSSPCLVDKGVPVVLFDSADKKAKLVGLNGGNLEPCGSGGNAIRVTKVSSYLDWIKSTTGVDFCTP